jgi:hypothetical protein
MSLGGLSPDTDANGTGLRKEDRPEHQRALRQVFSSRGAALGYSHF